jgi:hypothetical protein
MDILGIVSMNIDKEKLLISYLLGNLAEVHRLRLERKFLGDDQFYERLLALEDELFYDYAQGKLSSADRKQFEIQFLTFARNRKREKLASALIHNISEAAPVVKIEPDLARLATPQFLWSSLKSFSSIQSRAMRVSLATLAIMLLVLIWLAYGKVMLRNDFDQLRAEQALHKDRLQRQSQQERARAEELTRQLRREKDENALLRQKLIKMKARSARHGERLLTVIPFVLLPSVVRDLATGMKKLYIPPGVHRLKLQLNLKGEAEHRSYQVTLLTDEGVERWSQDMFRAERRDSGHAIVVSLPSRLLEVGDYELRLKGTASDGTQEETGDYYYFSIVKN